MDDLISWDNGDCWKNGVDRLRGVRGIFCA